VEDEIMSMPARNRPSVDPHGDPIPDVEGVIHTADHHTLLTCPVGASLVVSRVLDQDAEFLHFVEQNDLKPGQPVTVRARDAAADRVIVRTASEADVALGNRAASKLLVEPA
jgi:DtxR family Mn-dependent transcriptional regulator